MSESSNSQKLIEDVSKQTGQLVVAENKTGLESDTSQQVLTASEVCQEVGLSCRTIRNWINLGVIDIEERPAGSQKKRIYTSETVDQIKRVISLKELQYSLSEIKSLKDSLLSDECLADLELRLSFGGLGHQVYNWVQTDLVSSFEQGDAKTRPRLSEATVKEVAKIKSLRESQFSPDEIKRMIDDGLSYEAIEAISERVIKPADITKEFDVSDSSLRNWTALGLLKKADISKYGRSWYDLEALEICALILDLKQQGYQMRQIVDRFIDNSQLTKEYDPSQKLLRVGQISQLVIGLNKSILQEYVKKGLLQPSYIDDRGWRYYTEKDVALIRSLKYISDSGLRISEIKVMLDKGMTFEQMQDFIENHLKVDQVAEELNASPATVTKWARMGLLQTLRLSASINYLWYPKTGLSQAREVKRLMDLGIHSQEIKAALLEGRLQVLSEDTKDIVSLSQLAELFGVSSRQMGRIVRFHNLPHSQYSRHSRPLFNSLALVQLEEKLSLIKNKVY